jgi:hypothetical protein
VLKRTFQTRRINININNLAVIIVVILSLLLLLPCLQILQQIEREH